MPKYDFIYFLNIRLVFVFQKNNRLTLEVYNINSINSPLITTTENYDFRDNRPVTF